MQRATAIVRKVAVRADAIVDTVLTALRHNSAGVEEASVRA